MGGSVEGLGHSSTRSGHKRCVRTPQPSRLEPPTSPPPRAPHPAALAAHLNGTDLGSLGQYFGEGVSQTVLRCVVPDALPYAWDLSGAAARRAGRSLGLH